MGHRRTEAKQPLTPPTTCACPTLPLRPSQSLSFPTAHWALPHNRLRSLCLGVLDDGCEQLGDLRGVRAERVGGRTCRHDAQAVHGALPQVGVVRARALQHDGQHLQGGLACVMGRGLLP